MNINNKTYLAILLFFCSLFILLNFSSCDDGPTEPEVKPGSRDYTWSVDTLEIPFAYLYKLWGNAINNMWAVGPGGGLDKTIWHFNGVKWQTDGISRIINPQCIYGFENDIWIAGAEGRIWKYDGKQWTENHRFESPELSFIHIKDIWGENKNNIYAVGFGDTLEGRVAIILHYNGISWKRVEFKTTFTTMVRIRKSPQQNGNYYLVGVQQNMNAPDLIKIFEFKGSMINEIYSNIWSSKSGCYMQIINNELIFTIGNGIYNYSDNIFKPIIKTELPNYYVAISGSTKSDIFWLMRNGVTHYNGENIEYVLEESNINTWDLFYIENNVFVLANDLITNNVLIFRGIKN